MLRTTLLALAIAIPGLALAAGPPEVPGSEVQVVEEDNAYIFHNVVDDHLLYTYDKDVPGKSNCNDACAAMWRPLWTSAGAKPIGRWTVVNRDDGTAQWAYDGKPVYSFARDPEAGWHALPAIPKQ